MISLFRIVKIKNLELVINNKMIKIRLIKKQPELIKIIFGKNLIYNVNR